MFTQTAAKAVPPAPVTTAKPASDIQVALAATLPRFDPHPVVPEPATNPHIKRLPAYLVREMREPVFNEKHLFTKKGLQEVAIKRYFPGLGYVLNYYTLPLFGRPMSGVAMERYWNDDIDANLREIDGLLQLDAQK